jgi:hypothetical protein
MKDNPQVFAVRALALFAAFVALGGCEPRPAPGAGDADGTYTARGEIVRVDAPSRDVWIHHEAIPTFRDAKGVTVGMESMTMPFPAGADLPLTDLAPGARGEFTFSVRWTGERPLRLERWTPLPAGTTLAFDPPPADQPAAVPE